MDFGYVDVGELAGMAIGFGLVVVLPIVALLLAHQRKMAEVIHRQPSLEVEAKIARLQAQLDELRVRSADQALALDDCQRMLALKAPERPPRSVEI